jgi:hypothetical protein
MPQRPVRRHPLFFFVLICYGNPPRKRPLPILRDTRRRPDESRRAMIAARLETMRHGGDRKSSEHGANRRVDCAEYAQLSNVSPNAEKC